MCLILLFILQVWLYFRNSSISEIYIFEQNPIFLPFRKAEDTPSPALSKARSRRLRLALDSLSQRSGDPSAGGYGASSIFAQLGIHFYISCIGLFFPENGLHFINLPCMDAFGTSFFRPGRSLSGSMRELLHHIFALPTQDIQETSPCHVCFLKI